MLKLVAAFSALVAAPLMLAAAQPQGTLVPIDVQHSSLTAHVGKQGIFAFAADNHEVYAPIASGGFNTGTRSIEFKIDASKMRVLDPQMAPDRRAQVQSNMLGPQVLDVQKYPDIMFRSTSSRLTNAKTLSVSGDLTLHGQTHPITVEVSQPDPTHFKGTAAVMQTAFGISPIRLAGGTVRVKDEVRIDFAIALQP